MCDRLSGTHKPVGGRLPYGYRWRDEQHSGLDLDPETAPVVKQIFAWVESGWTLRRGATELNRRGVRTPTGRGH